MTGTIEPGAAPHPPSKSVQALRQEVSRLKDASANQEAELQIKIAQAEAAQRVLAKLQREVDDAADDLIRADVRLATDQASLAAMLDHDLIDAWSKPDREGVFPSQRLNDMHAVVLLRAGIEDFPRVRAILADRCTKANDAMTKFVDSPPAETRGS